MSNNSFVKERKNIETERHLSIWISKIGTLISPQKLTRNIQVIFKKPLLFIPIKPDLLTWKITLFIKFQVTPVKNQFRIGASLWNKVQQTLKAVPLSTFWNQLQEFVFSQY